MADLSSVACHVADATAPSWYPDGLPAGDWSERQRRRILRGFVRAGWAAVGAGEFAPLKALYAEGVALLPRIMVDASDIDRAADLYTLLHIMLWRRTERLAELAPFNDDVVRPFCAFLARHLPAGRPHLTGNAVPRIAYLSETSSLFGANAVARITVSLMLGQHALRGADAAPILYCLNPPADDLLAFAATHGLTIRDVSAATPGAAMERVLLTLREDAIDMLVADSNCAVATMVMQRRPVVVQAFHENGFAPWAIPELDLALLGITPPTPGLFAAAAVVARTPRNTAHIFQTQDRPAADIDALRALIREESGVARPSVVYGVYGRMAKLTPAYMARIDAILRHDPCAVFFAGGTGRAGPVLAAKAASPAGARMVIHRSFVDGHVAARCLDVFLDTYPFPGGMSCIEAQARGVPVVWMAPPPDAAQAIIGDQRDPALRARDADDYDLLAARLADPATRLRHGRVAAATAARFGDMRGQAMLVERHLRAAWARATAPERQAA